MKAKLGKHIIVDRILEHKGHGHSLDQAAAGGNACLVTDTRRHDLHVLDIARIDVADGQITRDHVGDGRSHRSDVTGLNLSRRRRVVSVIDVEQRLKKKQKSK